jgi:hypothetical protein
VTVTREVEAEIARLYHAEHWKIGAICAQLGVHDEVVRPAAEEGAQEDGCAAAFGCRAVRL